MTDKDVWMAKRRDYHNLVKVRAEWMDEFVRVHPAPERWCPAQCRIPRIEDERLIHDHLVGRKDGFAVAAGPRPDAYILCRTEKDKGELLIEGQTPRVSPRVQLGEAGDRLLEFVLQHAAEQGLKKVRVHLHGFPDEVDPLISLYQRHGIELDDGRFRFEMLSRQLQMDPGPRRLRFRSADQTGLDAACAVEAALCDWSIEHTKGNLEFSRKMWSVPDNDWLIAYEDGSPAGTVRMAVTPEGVGVVDQFGLLEQYRGRGLGIHLLAAGLSRLVGRTQVVWLDVDQDNTPAVRVYERAGFQVHHHHGGMTAELPSG